MTCFPITKILSFRSKDPDPERDARSTRERSTSNRRSSLERPTSNRRSSLEKSSEVTTRRRSSLEKVKSAVKPVPEILPSKDE